jgi:excisionase family DNA binding protein
MPITQFSPVLTVKAACQVAGISRTKLYELLGLNLIRAVKIGVKTLIDTGSLLSYLEGLPQAQIKPLKRAAAPAEIAQRAVERAALAEVRAATAQTKAALAEYDRGVAEIAERDAPAAAPTANTEVHT